MKVLFKKSHKEAKRKKVTQFYDKSPSINQTENNNKK